MKKRNLKTQIKENPLRAFVLFVIGYLVAAYLFQVDIDAVIAYLKN